MKGECLCIDNDNERVRISFNAFSALKLMSTLQSILN